MPAGFIVRFSRPVLEKTLKRDVITINAVTTEQATGWRVARRIPVVGVDLEPEPGYLKDYPELPKGTTNQMRVKVRPEWVQGRNRTRPRIMAERARLPHRDRDLRRLHPRLSRPGDRRESGRPESRADRQRHARRHVSIELPRRAQAARCPGLRRRRMTMNDCAARTS